MKREIELKKKVTKPKVEPVKKPRTEIVEHKKEILNDKVIEDITKPEEQVESTETAENAETEEVFPEPTPVFQLTDMPRFLHKNTPVYPAHLRNIGVEGIVKLQLLIDEKGNVRKVSVLSSAGDSFDNEAIRAMYKSTFIPAKVNDKSVAVLLTMPVQFRLM